METVKDTNGNHVDLSAAFDEALKGHAHEKRKERANGKHRAGKHGKLVRASDRGKYSLVKHSLAASGIEDALARLAFNETDEHWYFYQNGLWEAISDQKARNLIDAAIEQETYVPEGQFGYNCSYVDGVRTQLKRPLGLELNAAPRHLLPFQNGVLDLTTQTLRACSIEDGFTWRLPFDYDPQARCGAFKNWLSWTVGDDPGLVSLLRAFIKAVILGRADFQRYLELIGPGGSGKGTLTRVIEALMGAGNVHVTELKHLEGNRFETAGLYGKHLCLITDAEKYSGDVSVLKGMTGGDSLRHEEKHKQRGGHFRFGGLVIVAANQDIASSDYTSGLERRRITVRFERVVDPKDRRDLDAEFAPLIPGILNWALAMPDEEMRRLLVETNRYVTGASHARLHRLLATNPVANWLDDRVAYAPGAKTGIGEKRTNLFGHVERLAVSLYSNYCDWCDATGHKQQAQNSFGALLKDTLAVQMRLPGVEYKHEKTGSYFYGIRIRHEDESIEDVSPLRQGIKGNEPSGAGDSPESPDNEPGGDGPGDEGEGGDEPVTNPVTNETRMVTRVTNFSQKKPEIEKNNKQETNNGGKHKNSSKVRHPSHGAASSRHKSVTSSSPLPTSPSPSSPSSLPKPSPEEVHQYPVCMSCRYYIPKGMCHRGRAPANVNKAGKCDVKRKPAPEVSWEPASLL